ncbi:MAG: helix-turn-helix transcriptional regulator [Clostridia bacterium]|nr:helix-turn-helix transcriptional regulator [Clostridia bacterium]MBQ8446234.1 helix-turn-helix transcriptional regulator [Clostridia bacterium]
MKNFATKLKEVREQNGVSQKKIAEYLGITRSAYSNYEQGIREPSLDLFQKICQFFDVKAEYFWE